MTINREQQIAQKLVSLARSSQPSIAIAGNKLQVVHHGRTVSIPIFGASVLSDRTVRSR